MSIPESTGKVVRVGEQVIPPEFALHDTLPTQIAVIDNVQYLVYPNGGSVKKDGKIHFFIQSDQYQYIHPKETYIVMKSELTKPDGSRLPEPFRLTGPDRNTKTHNPESDFAFVNGISHAWFKNVEVTLNNILVDHGDNMYAYRGDLETRLSYGKRKKEGFLHCIGWHEEDTPFDDLADGFEFPNERAELDSGEQRFNAAIRGIFERYFRTAKGKVLWSLGRIHSYLFDQPKALPPNTSVGLSFDRNADDFVLLSKQADPETKCKPKIADAWILVKISRVDESVSKDIQTLHLDGENIRYPYRRPKLTTFTHPAHGSSMYIPNLLVGENEVPRRLIFGFVKEAAKSGNHKLDPFNYVNANVSMIDVRVGGESRPFKTFNINYGTGDYLLPWYSLVKSAGYSFDSEELGITYNNYPTRHCLYGFHLSGYDNPEFECFDLPQKKTVSLDVHFRTPPTEALTLIVYAEFGAEHEVDGATNAVEQHENA